MVRTRAPAPAGKSRRDRPLSAWAGLVEAELLARLRSVRQTRLGVVAEWVRGSTLTRAQLLTAGELLAIAVWSLVVTRPYLQLDPAVVPAGREYLSAIQAHHLWTRATECGWCALWNGSVRGGAPALVDPHGSMLHPLVIATTLGWGVLNGSKLALVGSFVMAGFAQWWLGRVLGLGRVARLWSAGMAVAAGHLAGKMELGAFGVVLSTAACGLVLPPLIALTRTGSRRMAVALGVALALVGLAGQGYMQLGLALTLPAAGLLLPRERERLGLLGRRFTLAAGLAVLLSSPFLVPFLHFLPQFAKDMDPAFRSAQPFPFVPLNLLINDPKFYLSDALSKFPYPHLYVNFVGWAPVLLALVALTQLWDASPGGERRFVAFLATAALIALWVSSAVPLAGLAALMPMRWLAEQLAGARHPPQIAALAVPAILALAAIAVDRLLRASWPQLRLTVSVGASLVRPICADVRWLLAIPLVLALADARVFSTHWVGTRTLGPDVPRVLEALRTADLQWVNPPFGEHFWIESAVAAGLKMHVGIRTWHWKARPNPEPVLEANRVGPPPGMTLQSVVEGVPIYAAGPGRDYAAVMHRDTSFTVCTARGTGGHIDVACSAAQPGVLTVKENSWSGWKVMVDGRRLPLKKGQWLAVDLPAGNSTVQLRYQPWDVPLGLLLALAGLVLAVAQWRKRAAA